MTALKRYAYLIFKDNLIRDSHVYDDFLHQDENLDDENDIEICKYTYMPESYSQRKWIIHLKYVKHKLGLKNIPYEWLSNKCKKIIHEKARIYALADLQNDLEAEQIMDDVHEIIQIEERLKQLQSELYNILNIILILTIMYFINPPFSNYINLPHLTPIKGSYTLEPRDGLFMQILKTLRYSFKHGGWINKIGLRNKGIDYALKNYKENEIISIAILDKKEIPIFLKKIPENVNLEINISCPNTDKKMIDENIQKFINNKRKWCIIKLSPLCDSKLIDNYYNIGFRQFHCSNTLPIKEGGLSGKTLIPYNQKLISYLHKNYNDIQIIGGGGITKWEDVQKYKSFGANHFSFSTVTFCPYLFINLYNALTKNK